VSTTPSPPRRPPVFGPEPWEEIGGGIWSHWDLWFCAVTVADHDGRLDQLEERLVGELADRTGSREGTESKLSHLDDLRVRLDDAGLAPGDLATRDVLSERGLLAKARKKLAERYLEGRAKTPAMIETPRIRLERRSRTGHWDAFPVNPERYYRSFRRNVEVKDYISERRSFSAVRRIEERLESLDKAGLAVGERLALYRAFHTAGLELADRADDSFGNVGEMRREAWHTYLRIDWQAAGMAPEAYWADLCDLVVFEDYALEFEEETLPWHHVPAGQAELVEGVLLALEAECRAFHLDYPADQALEQLAWLAVAGRGWSAFHPLRGGGCTSRDRPLAGGGGAGDFRAALQATRPGRRGVPGRRSAGSAPAAAAGALHVAHRRGHRRPRWQAALPQGCPGVDEAGCTEMTLARYRQSGARKKRPVHQPGDHLLGDRREAPDVHADVDHAALLAPLLMHVPVEQPHSLVDRPELGVAIGLTAVALVREVADEDHPVADGHRKRSLANLVEPGVEVLLLQAEGSLPVSVPAAVVVPRVQDLVPGETTDERHRLLPPTHCDIAEDVDGVVRADDGVPVRDEHGVHLADAVERPAAVPDDVLVAEVLVCGEVAGHGSWRRRKISTGVRRRGAASPSWPRPRADR